MATQEQKAQAKAAQIERYGDTLTMEDGVTTIKAIPDTNPDNTRSAAPQDVLDAGRTNLCLFHVTMAGYQTYMKNENQTITRGGIKWTIEGPARNVSFSDVSLVVVLIASSSGNPA